MIELSTNQTHKLYFPTQISNFILASTQQSNHPNQPHPPTNQPTTPNNPMTLSNHTYHTTAVDGGWTMWYDWSKCGSSCGFDGSQMRKRSCTKPSPGFDGRPCDGARGQRKSCFITFCRKSSFLFENCCNYNIFCRKSSFVNDLCDNKTF